MSTPDSIDRTPQIDSRTALTMARRSFLQGGGRLTLSAAAVTLLAGCESIAASSAATAGDDANDVRILNTALAAEHEAVAAYQVGAESGLLSKPVLDLAAQFQGHHKEHADMLAKTVATLGGTPAEARGEYDFGADGLQNEADVVRFAAGLEKGAVSAYLGAVPLFTDSDLARAAASILGDEAMHWAVLRYALGENPVPVAFVS